MLSGAGEGWGAHFCGFLGCRKQCHLFLLPHSGEPLSPHPGGLQLQAGGTVCSMTPGGKTQDGDGAVPGTAWATPALPNVGSFLLMHPLLGSALHSSCPEDTGTCSGHRIQVAPAASTKVEKGTSKFCRKILLEVWTITAPWLQGGTGRGRALCFWGESRWHCQGAGDCNAGPSGQAASIQG